MDCEGRKGGRVWGSVWMVRSLTGLDRGVLSVLVLGCHGPGKGVLVM